MTAILNNSKERTRFFKFVVVGVIGAVVDFGTMNIMVGVFNASLVVGGTVSFIAAIISNFSWNRFWTYPDSREKPILNQLVQFSIVSVAGLVIRIPILKLLEPLFSRMLQSLSIPNSWVDLLGKNITLAVAVLIVMFWNFFINRYWTYNDVD